MKWAWLADRRGVQRRGCVGRGKIFNETLEIGVMIEVPTAAIMADLIAREVDFFSIGTNDLIQYSVAIDRTNERVAHLYEPSHPSVVRLLKMVADAAHANDIWVGVCGEMAGEVLFTPLLLGLGMDETERRRIARSAGQECGPAPNDGGMPATGSRGGPPARYALGDSGALHRKWRKGISPSCSVNRSRCFCFALRVRRPA